MAEQLIASLEAEFDPSSYRDEYQERVTAFLQAKAEGQDVEVTPPERDAGGPDYGAMSKDELYELAQQRDLPGRSSMSKDDLAEVLAASDGADGAGRAAEAS